MVSVHSVRWVVAPFSRFFDLLLAPLFGRRSRPTIGYAIHPGTHLTRFVGVDRMMSTTQHFLCHSCGKGSLPHICALCQMYKIVPHAAVLWDPKETATDEQERDANPLACLCDQCQAFVRDSWARGFVTFFWFCDWCHLPITRPNIFVAVDGIVWCACCIKRILSFVLKPAQ